MTLGYLKQKKIALSPVGQEYIELLKQHIRNYGFEIFE